MMGMQTAPAQLFYDFCLDDHVPDDHLLRRIDRFLDLEKVCFAPVSPGWRELVLSSSPSAIVATHEPISSFCSRRAGKIAHTPAFGYVTPSGHRHADPCLDTVHGNESLEMLDVGVFEKQAATQAFIFFHR